MGEVRITVAVATVLRAFLDNAAQPRYGYDLMKATGFPSGKLYPILARLQAADWLEKQVEDVDPAAAGRPARRLYRINPDRVAAIRTELAALSDRLRPAPPGPGGRLRPEGGPR
jgi:PadR family transcriptional regulator